VRPAYRCIALVLLTVLMGSLFLPAFSDRWYEGLPWHDHILLGPMVPGWENHHHGPWTYPGASSHAQPDLAHRSGRQPGISLVAGIGVHTVVLSLYRLPEAGTSIFSFATQMMHSAQGWTLPELSPFLILPLSLGFLSLASVFLRPPDKPPRLAL
jgi:hypothetical protein